MNKGQTLLKCKPRALPWLPTMLALLCLLFLAVGERAAMAQTVATPTYSPSGGTYAGAQTVTISDSTSGATIYFTTNGTTPTTSSTKYTAPISVASSETVEAIGVESGDTNSAVGTAGYTINTSTVATPTFSPAAGAYTGAQSVTISDSTSGSTIYYTTNGTTPTTSSTKYTAAISVTASETIEAIATASGDTNSAVASAAYTINTGSTISNGTYKIVCDLSGLALDDPNGGGSGTGTDQQTYSGADQQWTITSIGTGSYYEISSVANGLALTGATSKAQLTVAAYTGATNQLWSFVSTTGSYYYITNESTSQVVDDFNNSMATGNTVGQWPTNGGTNQYWSLTSVSTTGAAATPTFSPAAGTYSSTQSVTISDTTTGATIYYTTNGTTPTTSSTKYTGAISVTSSETIEAIATASGDTNSAVASAAYTINAATAATPTFSPGGGSYSSTQSVTISDSTSGSTIYYTTNGTTPTTSSTQYTGAISVGTSETVEAIAAASGYSNSAVGSATYTYTITQTQTAATPTYSPSGGTYSGTQTVTISDTTSGATIYYTTNGATPSTSSTQYTGAISVATSETVEAIAAASGYNNSAVGTAGYTINSPTAATPTFSPAAGTYSGAQSVTISDTTSGATIYYTTNGATPTTSSTKYTGAISVASSETVEAIATASGYNNSSVGSAAYTITAPSAATPTFSPAAGTYSSSQTVTISDTTSGATIYYTTNGTTPTTSSTQYTGSISVTASETIEAIAAASGYSNSSVGSAAYTITLPNTAATPTFSPGGGAYSSTQSVTISDSTSGSTIYYTTNGATPTTSSTKYTGAISVGVTETIEAIAAASGYNNSSVGSAAYTISTGSGGSYYVSPSGSDSNPGTLASPWLTPQHAANVVGPGSTVYLETGTYGQFEVNVSGSASGGYITFTNYPGDAAVIDGTGWVGTYEQGLIDIEDQSYIQIVGLEIRNAISNSLTFVPDGVYVRNQSTSTTAMSHIVIQNCYIHNIEVTATNGSGEGNAHGISSEGDTATAATALTNVTVTGCTFENMVTGWSETCMFKGNLDTFTFTNNLVQDNNNIGVDMAGGWGNSSNPAVDMARNGYCAGNTVDNCSTKSNPAYNDYSCAGIYVDGGDNIIIEHNISYNNDIGIQCSSERPGFNSQYVAVRSNLVYNSNTQGLGMGGYNDTLTGGTKNCSFVNNTFYNDDIQKSGKGEFWGAWFADNNLWENNICYGGPEGLFVNFQVPDTTDNDAVCNYNDYYDATISNADSYWTYVGGLAKVGFTINWQALCGEDLQSTWSDPLFVSIGSNFNVSAGSPALAAGNGDLGNITFDPTWASTNTLPTGPVVGTLDLAGNPRTTGSTIDDGAFED